LRGGGRRDYARLRGNNPVHDFGRVGQRVAGEVGIALRGAGIGVTEQRLHHVERDAFIDQEARKRRLQTFTYSQNLWVFARATRAFMARIDNDSLYRVNFFNLAN
jgi:hypothetical protein